MDFASIPAGTYELGWRFSDELPADAGDALNAMGPMAELLPWFSKHRRVELGAFEIAVEAIPFDDVLGDPYDLEEGVTDLETLCRALDLELDKRGWRLPSEDELEAACGGSLFPWGMCVPPGIPYGKQTSFEAHKHPTKNGMRLNHDPYKVEVVTTALKLGDGGRAICGGDPWPLAWLTLSPSFRLRDANIRDCFVETLEQALVRPVMAR